MLHQNPTAEQIALAKSVLDQLRNPDYNGEHATVDAIARHERKARYDGTINLGHVLTIVAMVGTLLIIWSNGRVQGADHELRLKNLESAQAEFKQGFAKIAEAERVSAENQARITIQMDLLLRDRGIINPPK